MLLSIWAIPDSQSTSETAGGSKQAMHITYADRMTATHAYIQTDIHNAGKGQTCNPHYRPDKPVPIAWPTDR